LCINGNEWAKRQAARAGIGFDALDNGFAACDDPVRLQRLCGRLDAAKIDQLARKWLKILPHPFTPADRRAGYRYDVGRHDRVSLIFDRRIQNGRRRPTVSRFRTQVFTRSVTPSLHVEYKHSKIKQYHKEGKALRTETTINDTNDFGIGKRLCNLPALRKVGFSANRRLLDAQTISHDPIIGDTVFNQIHQPTTVEGQRVPGLKGPATSGQGPN
jgi:hypothetical protein